MFVKILGIKPGQKAIYITAIGQKCFSGEIAFYRKCIEKFGCVKLLLFKIEDHKIYPFLIVIVIKI